MLLPRAAHALLAGFVAVLIVQHAIEPGLGPGDHQISEYANGSAGPLMTAGFVAWAGSLAILASLTWRTTARRSRGGARALTALIACAAVGLMITAVFATQTVAGELPPGVVRDTPGRLHDIGSGIVLLTLLAAVPVSLASLSWPAGRRHAVIAVAIAVLAVAVGTAVAGVFPGGRQRILVALSCFWQTAAVRTAARRS